MSEKNVPVVHKDENSFFHTFDQIQEKIRKRAYDFFVERGFEDGDHLGDWMRAESEVLTKVSLKAVDNGKEFVIEGKVEGFEPNEIEVKVDGDALLITGLHSESKEEESDGRKSSTSKTRSFYERFHLPPGVDRDQVEASVKRNKLKVSIPKTADA